MYQTQCYCRDRGLDRSHVRLALVDASGDQDGTCVGSMENIANQLRTFCHGSSRYSTGQFIIQCRYALDWGLDRVWK
jgi:hypothetical protein